MIRFAQDTVTVVWGCIGWCIFKILRNNEEAQACLDGIEAILSERDTYEIRKNRK